jgi:hypothetical protein
MTVTDHQDPPELEGAERERFVAELKRRRAAARQGPTYSIDEVCDELFAAIEHAIRPAAADGR